MDQKDECSSVAPSESLRTRQKGDDSRSPNRRFAIVLAALIGAVMLVFGGVLIGIGSTIIVADDPGYCAKDGKHHSDEEFIRAAVVGHIHKPKTGDGTLSLMEDRQFAIDYVATNPDCCVVFRRRSAEIENASRLLWMQSAVVVRIRTEASLTAYRRGERPRPDMGLLHVLVGNCLDKSVLITDLLEGG
jgi:hypothetical protein